MALLAHHTRAFFEVEILGQPFPDGPTEHVIALAVTGLVVLLTAYGVYALGRDLWRWRRRSLG